MNLDDIDPLPHSLMDTSTLSAKRAEQTWREAIGVMFDTRQASNTGEALLAKVDAFMFGELGLGLAHSYAQHFDRNRSDPYRSASRDSTPAA